MLLIHTHSHSTSFCHSVNLAILFYAMLCIGGCICQDQNQDHCALHLLRRSGLARRGICLWQMGPQFPLPSSRSNPNPYICTHRRTYFRTHRHPRPHLHLQTYPLSYVLQTSPSSECQTCAYSPRTIRS